MQVNLDLHELSWLLDACSHGSHLRSDTFTKCVDDWYSQMTEYERMQLFGWMVQLTYNGKFEPRSSCCGKDVIFMKRFHPENQYKVTFKHKYKGYDDKWHTKTEKLNAYLMGGKYYITSTLTIAEEYIIKVEKIDLSEQWNRIKHKDVDYDTNIID